MRTVATIFQNFRPNLLALPSVDGDIDKRGDQQQNQPQQWLGINQVILRIPVIGISA